MLIRVAAFGGQVPKVEPQMLEAWQATEAINCKLWSGALRPYYGLKSLGLAALYKSGSGIVKSLFRHNVTPSAADSTGNFFHSHNVAHYARAPIAGDIIWVTAFTGDGLAPRITDASKESGPDYPSSSELLGVPIPNVAGSTATVAGVANGDADPVKDGVQRDYVIAFVNARGQVGPTSLPIVANAIWLPGQSVSLAGLPTAPAGSYTPVTSKRIYRLGADGTARYFVAEISVANTTFSDTVNEISLGEAPVNAGWEPPPTEMHSIGVMSNGIAYGAFRNQACISEQWQIHAWNPINRETLNYDIVAMGHFGTTIVALTAENPYAIYGYDPAAMRAQQYNIQQGCLSALGTVSAIFGVAYPSKEGLVLVNESGPEIITERYFTKDEWQDLKPSTFNAAVYSDRYLAFYNTGAVQRGLILDPVNADSGVVFTDVHATALYTDPVAQALYVVVGGVVKQWDADRAAPLEYTWRSKEFVSQHATAIQWGRILADSYANLDCEFYVDGVLKYVKTVTDNKPWPMPQGNKGRVFQFRLIGTDSVTEASFASSPTEFR